MDLAEHTAAAIELLTQSPEDAAAAQIRREYPNVAADKLLGLAYLMGQRDAIRDMRVQFRADEERGLGAERGSRSYAEEVDDPLIGDRRALARSYR